MQTKAQPRRAAKLKADSRRGGQECKFRGARRRPDAAAAVQTATAPAGQTFGPLLPHRLGPFGEARGTSELTVYQPAASLTQPENVSIVQSRLSPRIELDAASRRAGVSLVLPQRVIVGKETTDFIRQSSLPMRINHA